MKQPRSRLLLGLSLLIPILLLVGLGALFTQQMQSVTREHEGVEQRNQATEATMQLGALFHEQQMLLRQAEIATGGTSSYPLGQRALAQLHLRTRIQLALLQKMLRNDQRARLLLDTLNNQYLLWVGWAQQTLDGKTYGLTSAQNSMHGAMLQETAHGTLRQLIEEQYALQSQQSAALQTKEARAQLITQISALLTGLLLGLLAIIGTLLVRRPWVDRLKRQIKATEVQKNTSQALKNSLDLITEGLLCFDRNGKLLSLNVAATHLIGFSADQAIGRPATEVCPLFTEQEHLLPEHPVMKACQAQSVERIQGEGLLIRKAGEQHSINYSATALLGEEGQTMGVVLTLIDITERRLGEQALQASEKLASAGRMTASIAHEILNPLDAVANLQYLVETETDPKQQKEHLALAREELTRIILIVRNILSLYREAIRPVLIDMAELVQGVLLLLEHRIGQLQVTIEQCYEQNCLIKGFPAELRQVVSNVLVNALDAVGTEGRIKILMEFRAAEELSSSGVLLRVIDSGAGISQESLQRIFKAFYTTKGEAGTGLGLWASLAIVQKHGGSIRIYNSTEPNLHGACVAIFLPSNFPFQAAPPDDAEKQKNITSRSNSNPA